MAEQKEPVLLCETSNGVATLTLNRPRQRNALSMAPVDGADG
jgi:enoyl-CoA hydratase/carnithine racemase